MKQSARFHGVDALRGFDMFWIIGGDFLVHYLFAATGAAWLGALSFQLTHAEWAGFRAYDLIFPLFMFLSGVSAGIVLQRDRNQRTKAENVGRAARRAAILVILGVFYNWGWRVDLEEIRFASVLGLIGGAYFIAVVALVLLERLRSRLLALVSVLVMVSALQLLAPTPGFGPGVLTPDGSINSWIDQNFLPGRLHGGTYDPEGLLGIISGASITLAGGIVGADLMDRKRRGAAPNLIGLALIGAGLILLALALWPEYPPIKKIWTATFDILSIGLCMVLLALALALFEGGRFVGLRMAFAVIGANSILIYFAARYFLYPVYGWASDHEWSAALSAFVVLVILILEWAVLYVLYRRKWLLRV